MTVWTWASMWARLRCGRAAGCQGGLHTETGCQILAQRDQVAVHPIYGRPPGGRVPHRTELATRHDAPFQERFDVLAVHIHADQHDFLIEGNIGEHALGALLSRIFSVSLTVFHTNTRRVHRGA